MREGGREGAAGANSEGGREAGTKIYGSFTNDGRSVGRGFLRSCIGSRRGGEGGREEAALKLGPMSNNGDDDELVSWCGGVNARNQREGEALVGHSATLLVTLHLHGRSLP